MVDYRGITNEEFSEIRKLMERYTEKFDDNPGTMTLGCDWKELMKMMEEAIKTGKPIGLDSSFTDDQMNEFKKDNLIV